MQKLSNKDIEKRVAEYRQIYSEKTLFYTEDGNVFLEKSPAIDHANKTKQKWFESEAKKEKVIQLPGIDKEIAKDMLINTEISDETDYKLAKELVAALELKPASNKKDDLLVALEDYKNSIKA